MANTNTNTFLRNVFIHVKYFLNSVRKINCLKNYFPTKDFTLQDLCQWLKMRFKIKV